MKKLILTAIYKIITIVKYIIKETDNVEESNINGGSYA